MSRFRAPLALFFSILLLLLAPTIAVAAGSDFGKEKNEVSIDVAMPIVLNLLTKEGSTVYPVYLSYERVLSDHLVLTIAPSFAYADHVTYAAYLATLWIELDWHPFQDGLNGLFIGPAFAVIYSSDPDFTATGEGLGLSLGYQFLLPWNIDIDLAVGLAYGPLQSNDPFDPDTEIILRGALAIGFRF